MKTGVEFARLWEPGVAGVELFNAHLFRHSFGKHFHESYTIGIHERGQGQFLHHGATHYAYPGSFSLINPGDVHTGEAASNEGWKFRNIYISVSLMKQVLTQLEWSDRRLPEFDRPVVWDEPLQQSFDQLFQSLSQPTSHLERQTHMLEMLSQLVLRHASPDYMLRSPQSEPHAVVTVREYLQAHYAETVSIEALSKLVSLSPYYLIRSFHQQVGLPPHSYQRQWQLLQAKRSLHTSKPLAEIAVDHGFYDQSHLNRVFKRAFGVTPGQYRKSNFIQYC